MLSLTVDISCEKDVCLALSDSDVDRAVTYVLEQEGVERPCALSLSVVSDDEMHDLNLEWRDVDRPTDVLSLECERPDDPMLGADEPCELGDVILAPAYIARQSSRMGTTPAEETTLLLVHATLHLLGYDHIEDEDAQVMEEREDALLAELLNKSQAGHVELTRHGGEDA